jgi:uncharacterized protein (DUF4415 family)
MNHRKVDRAALIRPKRAAMKKALISVRIDRDVLDWFKSRGPGYQTRINSLLRAFRDASI